VYTGDGTAPNGGNPWFLCTAAMAELFYLASVEISQTGTLAVSQTTKAFWTYFAPSAGLSVGSYANSTVQFNTAIQALQGWGDAFVRLIQYHGGDSMHLSEEFHRMSGYQVGAPDLTWSYASLLTAGIARAQAMGDGTFVVDLANLGF
jgi:glucoamylase